MILFDIIMTLIEDFILSLYSYYVFKLSKKSYILFLSLILLLETYYFNYTIRNNLLLFLIIILTIFITTIIYTKTINFYYCIVPSVIIIILFLSNTIALYITSMIFNTTIISLTTLSSAVIYISIISRIIFIIVTHIFYKYFKKVDFKDLFSNFTLIPFIIFILALLSCFITLYESIFYTSVSHYTIEILLFIFFIVAILFFVILYKMINNFLINKKISNELIKSKYSKEIYFQINKLSDKILQDKHDIFYTLLNLKNNVNSKDKDFLIEELDKAIDRFKYNKLSNTSNIPIFDYYIINTINFFKQRGYNIKTLISVDNNQCLENWEVIDTIKKIIDYTIEYTNLSKKFDFQLYDQNGYLLLKIIVPKNNYIYSFKTINSNRIITFKVENFNHDNEISVLIN